MPPWHAQVFGSSVVQTPQPIKRSRGARPSPGRINTNGTPRATGRRRRAANAAQTSGYGAAISGSGAADAAQAAAAEEATEQAEAAAQAEEKPEKGTAAEAATEQETEQPQEK